VARTLKRLEAERKAGSICRAITKIPKSVLRIRRSHAGRKAKGGGGSDSKFVLLKKKRGYEKQGIEGKSTSTNTPGVRLKRDSGVGLQTLQCENKREQKCFISSSKRGQQEPRGRKKKNLNS